MVKRLASIFAALMATIGVIGFLARYARYSIQAKVAPFTRLPEWFVLGQLPHVIPAGASEIDTLLKEMSDIKTFVEKRLTENSKPLAEELERMKAGLTKAMAAFEEERRQRLMRDASTTRPIIRSGRFAGMDLFSLRILERVFESRAQANGGEYTPKARRYMDEIKAQRAAVVKDITQETLLGWHEYQLNRVKGYHGALPDHALTVFRESLNPFTRQLIELVSKALDSTTAGSGDELVPTLEAAELWMDVNMETRILPLLRQVPMPSNPFDIPAQFGDTNWYPASENVQVTTTDPGTAKTTLSAKGLKTGVPFSDELEEDAIINLVSELRSNLVRNAAEVIDDVLLNADQTAANSINADGATISATTAGKAHWLIGFDGVHHQAIVDNSANQSINVNAALAHTAYNSVLRKLGRYASPGRRGDVAFVVDVNTWIASLGLTQVLTLDVAGGRATLSTGELANIYGSPIIASEQYKLADTDGKVTDSGGNTVGRILGVNTTQWRVGFRRQVTLETAREAGKSQTTLYVSFRIALAERSGTRSTATHTAVAYNITGVS